MAMYTGKVIEILQVMGITAGPGGGWWRREMEQRVEVEKRGGGERKENEVEEGERERRRVGGGRRTESRRRESHMVCERIEKIKTSTATFQVLLYSTILDRRGDTISYNILPQYSYQGRSTLQACVTFPTPSCGKCC